MKRTLIAGIASLAMIPAAMSGAQAEEALDSISLSNVAVAISTTTVMQNVSQSFSTGGSPAAVTTGDLSFSGDSFSNMLASVNSVNTGVNSSPMGVVSVNLAFGSLSLGGVTADGTGGTGASTGNSSGAGLAALFGGVSRGNAER